MTTHVKNFAPHPLETLLGKQDPDDRIDEPVETAGNAVRDMARGLYWALIFDLSPTPGACRDFGIVSPDHYGALHHAVRDDGVTARDLDQALGKGAEIQKLISPSNPYRWVTFRTVWDDMFWTSSDPEEGEEG